ncbi:MAG: lipoate--protein ligase [Bacteroidota bacterium]
MLFINRNSTNPYINLATEEYVLKNFDDDCFMLWINEPCIIVGKHQNAIAEINIDYVKENNIPVIRRLSGGGTVFHDLGNLNFTFIKKENQQTNIDFKKFTQPIIDILNTLGIEAQHSNKSDITINAKKISGNAEHIWKHKTLHHGTLLFSSNINTLREAIKVKSGIYHDKAVKSNRSEVTNISEYLKKPLTIIQFYDLIIDNIKSKYSDIHLYELTKDDLIKIEELVETKYNTWKWNFGYSPNYTVKNTINTNSGKTITIELLIKDGLINEINLSGNYLDDDTKNILEVELKGIPHEEKGIISIIQKCLLNNNKIEIKIKYLLEGMF